MTEDLTIPVFLRASTVRRRADWDAYTKDRIARGLPPYTNPNAHVEATRSSFAAFDAQRLEKARGRVAAMLAKRADKTAASEGKTWDPIKGEWV